MAARLPDADLDQLFRAARTRNGWRPEPIPETMLRELYDLAKWGPTSANVSPARFVFLTSPEAKARLAPHLSNANRDKTMTASAVVIVAYDLAFAEKIPQLFPQNPAAAAWFADSTVAQETAFRNGSLQGAYLMLAARALGLDCGPMSGFDKAAVDAEFFAGAEVRANFICSLSYGTDEKLFPRLPRLAFDEACQLL
ncbi:malonic semialdehyde reductase [Phenylobacterium immobile]|uniref:malonic semialdehyde reductase n=1 Tax=Phenylobacterium immobile TaxID=21 RepID=UPI000AA1C680|nr:malonic semialdehyde reductase [Phenylobacterium immobile]